MTSYFQDDSVDVRPSLAAACSVRLLPAIPPSMCYVIRSLFMLQFRGYAEQYFLVLLLRLHQAKVRH